MQQTHASEQSVEELVSLASLADPVVLCNQHLLVEYLFGTLQHVLLEHFCFLIWVFNPRIQGVFLELTGGQ